ncbi:MAG TPA: hypothetical protein VH374_19870 [Polyangia bacterium]|nr:hypothetical protein [Polyangia bacterium]
MRPIAWLCGCLLMVACSGGSPGMSGDDGGSGGQSGSGTGGAAGGTGGASAGSGGTAGKDGGTSTDGGADAGLACAEIETMYETALNAAESCNPRAANQCQKSAAGNLTSCGFGCPILVNDDTQLNQLKQEWLQAHCDSQKPVVCPNFHIVCLPPQGTCIAAANDAGGTCGSAR